MKIKILAFLSIILSVLLLEGCEKDYSDVIEVENSSYQVVRVSLKNSFQYPIDTMAIFRVEIDSSKDINFVFCDVYSPDKNKLNNAPMYLLDNGNPLNGDITRNDNIYSCIFPLDSNQMNGNYEVKFYVNDKFNKTNQAAVSIYNYNNGKANIAPIISNTIVDPDTVVVTTTTLILTSVQVDDQNGLNDIEKVYFVVYRPDGTTNGNQNLLYDDGNLSDHGDQTAGDGIYSLLIRISPSNSKGTYRFEFQAKDRGGKLSNIINHSVLIQ